MEKTCLHVLIVEDSADDAELMTLRLEEEGFRLDWQRVETEEDYRAALKSWPDLILADWSLPNFSGLRALEILNDLKLDIPLILVSGSIGEEAAVEAMRRGACDYILKDRAKRLGQAVLRALEAKRYRLTKVQAEQELKGRLAELQILYNISSSLRYLTDLDVLLSTLLERTLEAIQTDTGGIWLENQADHKLHLNTYRGWFSGIRDTALSPNEGLVGKTFVADHPYCCPEYLGDPNLSPLNRGKILPGWGGVCLSIHCNRKKIGVLGIAVARPREIKPEEVKLLSSIAEIVGVAIHRVRLFEELRSTGEELAFAYDETIKGWAGALELRDHETEGHCKRVTDYTLTIAKKMGFTEDQLIHIYRGALLHDIGKMGVSDTVLLKPGPLMAREWEIMQRHPLYAYEMLSPIAYLKPALNIPYCHHEKYNGSGYPRGLRGEEIPLEARIFAVVDVFDALTSDRPYQRAWSREEALEHIKNESGRHFDPQVVEQFLEVVKDL